MGRGGLCSFPTKTKRLAKSIYALRFIKVRREMSPLYPIMIYFIRVSKRYACLHIPFDKHRSRARYKDPTAINAFERKRKNLPILAILYIVESFPFAFPFHHHQSLPLPFSSSITLLQAKAKASAIDIGFTSN